MRRDVAVCLLLAAAVVAIYRPVGDHDFLVYDDPTYVTENRHVRAGLTAEGIRWAFVATHGANWHPVTWLSHMFDWQLFGADAGMHHWVNLIFHAFNAMLVYLVWNRMTGSRIRCAFVAAMFAVHPLHVESVAWISERKDLLCAFFWMLTLWGYLWYCRRPAPGRYLAMTVFFVMGIMAKPMIVTLPVVLLLLDFWPLRRLPGGGGGRRSGVWRRVAEKLPLLALSAAASGVAVWAQSRAGALGSVDVFPLPIRAANAVVAYAAYLEKLICPRDLAVLYPFSLQIPPVAVWSAALLLAGVSALAFGARNRYPCLVTGWLWYLGTLVPVIGIVQVGMQAMADRYAYIPALGIWIMVAWAVPRRFAGRPRLRRAMVTVALVLVAALGWQSHRQVAVWKNSETLFAHALAVTTDNYAAHTNLGVAYARQGKTAAACEQYRLALKINPAFAKARNNLALILAQQGDAASAARQYRQALHDRPCFAAAHYNYAGLLRDQGDIRSATAHFLKAAACDPSLAAAHFALGDMAAAGQRFAAAVVHYQRAVAADPEMVAARVHLGNAYLAENRPAAAVAQYAAAIERDPRHAGAHNNLGIALVRLGRIGQAIAHFQAALRLAPEDAQTRRNLENARARYGKASP